MKNILVIGSTGNVGRALVSELVKAGEHVRAATRNAAQLEQSAQIQAVQFDYADSGTYPAALEGVDRVFMIGPPEATPHTVMIPFLQSALRDRRKFVLMTAMGTELDENGSLRQVELLLERSGAPYVILRPNWFMDNFHTTWLDPIQHAGIVPAPAADSRTSFIDARDIAASAAAVLQTNRFDGSAFTLTGPAALTYTEAAALVSKAAGRDIHYVPVDDESFIKSLLEAQVPDDLAHHLAMLFSFTRAGGAEPVSPAVTELTGRSPRTFAQYAADYAAVWK